MIKHQSNLTSLFISLLFLLSLSCAAQHTFGKAKIKELKSYEIDDEYFPHDCTLKSEMMEHPAEIYNYKDSLLIKNYASDGKVGHSIEFTLNTKLEITNVIFEEWMCTLDRNSVTYKIDKANMTLDSNPFLKENVIGYYTVTMTIHYKVTGIDKEQGLKDEIVKRKFKGKFKTFCDQ